MRVALLLFLVSCKDDPPPPSKPVVEAAAAIASSAPSTTEPVPTPTVVTLPQCPEVPFSIIENVEAKPGKPPSATYRFDIEMFSSYDKPKWLILPRTFPYDSKAEPRPGQGGINRLEASKLGPKVILVEAGGLGAFSAVYLAPQAHTKLKKLAIEAFWQSPRRETRLEVIIADDITIDSASIKSFFSQDLQTPDKGDGDVQKKTAIPLTKPLDKAATHTVEFVGWCWQAALIPLKHPGGT